MVDEVPALQLQDDLVHRIEEISHPPGQGVLDQDRLIDVRRLAQKNREHGAGRLEARIGGADGEIVFEDSHELAKVRVHPIAAGAFALLDDHLDRAAG